MSVSIVAFASAAEAMGCRQLDVELPAGSRVDDLRRVLVDRHPALEPLWSRLAVAVGGDLASPERELADGDEVALLPPVSGGLDEAPSATLVDGPIDVQGLVARVGQPAHGAVLLFLGTVRSPSGGREVDELRYDAYRPMATSALERIARELEAAHPPSRLEIVHRLGVVPVGEASVAIAVAAPHRDAAYEASRSALERLKREVPIWKQERFADGDARWREEEPLGGPV